MKDTLTIRFMILIVEDTPHLHDGRGVNHLWNEILRDRVQYPSRDYAIILKPGLKKRIVFLRHWNNGVEEAKLVLRAIFMERLREGYLFSP